MSFEITGKVHKIFPTEQKTDTFKAREFVIMIEQGNYPQYIKFQLTQDRCELIDSFNEGTEIKVYFDLRGREWNEKYFTNLNAWRIEAMSDAMPAPAPDDPFGETNFPPFPGEGDAAKNVQAEDMNLEDLPF